MKQQTLQLEGGGEAKQNRMDQNQVAQTAKKNIKGAVPGGLMSRTWRVSINKAKLSRTSGHDFLIKGYTKGHGSTLPKRGATQLNVAEAKRRGKCTGRCLGVPKSKLFWTKEEGQQKGERAQKGVGQWKTLGGRDEGEVLVRRGKKKKTRVAQRAGRGGRSISVSRLQINKHERTRKDRRGRRWRYNHRGRGVVVPGCEQKNSVPITGEKGNQRERTTGQGGKSTRSDKRLELG